MKYYLKDLNLHGGLDPHNIFPLFLNKILTPKLAKKIVVLLLMVVFQYYEGQLL